MATDQKLRELIVYVARRCRGDEKFGKTKLNKILFWADFNAYQLHGKSITGQEYLKKQYGPVGEATAAALAELVEAGDIDIANLTYFTQKRQVPTAMREANLDDFSGWEIALVEDVIRQVRPMNATEVSDLSHEFIGWRVAAFGDAIPYDTVFLDDSPVTEEEEAWAREVTGTAA
jgi:hypothetical protein